MLLGAVANQRDLLISKKTGGSGTVFSKQCMQLLFP
jgi:triphosphoribosyl-dephospho-CoA synthetase